MGNEISNLTQIDEFTACCTGSRSTAKDGSGIGGDYTIPDPARDRQRLFHLVGSGQHMMLDAFLQRKYGILDINAVNEKGDTALHVAARGGFLGCCKSLVAHGADVTLKDWSGKTPVDAARQTHHNFCEAFLQARYEAVKPKEEQTTAPTVNTSKPRNDGSEHAAYQAPEEETIAKVLYSYTASSAPPFPPDNRMEFSISEGEKLVLLETRADGWAIVKRKNGKKEGYVPGNYITIDGQHPLFDDEGKATGAVGVHGKKFKHLGMGNHHGKTGTTVSRTTSGHSRTRS